MTIAKKTIIRVSRFIDIKMGFLGAVFMSIIVFWVNLDHGAFAALIACLTQLCYTLFFGGLFLKMAENIAVAQSSRFESVLFGALIPMSITALLTFWLHTMKGTPEPLYSTVPTMFFAAISFGIWSWVKTR